MKKKLTALLALLLTAALIVPASAAKTRTYSGQCGPELYWEMSGSTAIITGQGEMWDYTTWNYCDYPETPFKQHWYSVRSAELPEGLTSIGNELFRGCLSLDAFSIPSTVTRIGDSTFLDCAKYAESCELTLPDGLTYLGNQAFYGCGGLSSEDFSLPAGLTYLGSSAFAGCSKLKADGLTIPAGITQIGYATFRSCIGLTGDLYIHEDVTSIGDSAFKGTGFDTVWFYGDAPAGQTLAGDDADYAGGLPEKAVLYYPVDAAGWTDSEDYDPETNTWNGHELRPWTPDEVALALEAEGSDVTVTLSNWTRETVSGQLWCAAYSETGKLLDICGQDVELEQMGETELTIGLSCPVEKVDSIKAFCLDEDCVPVAKTVELEL